MAPQKKPQKLAAKSAKSAKSAPKNAPVVSGPNSVTNHWPLQKYAFCMPNPGESESWSHFPQRDNLDLVIQQHRPLDGFLAEIVIVKIIWSMQTLMEINITELLMRNTSVQILCRPPSLGVKYQSPGGCTHRFQVTFKSENDMETVKNRFQDTGCQVSESPAKSDSMLGQSHSQQPQQQSQQSQFQQPQIPSQQWYGSSQTSGPVPAYSTPPASQQVTVDPFGNSHVQQLGMVTRALTDVLQLQQNQLHSQQQQVVQQQSQQHQYILPQTQFPQMLMPPRMNNPFSVAPQHTPDGMNMFDPIEQSDGPNNRFAPIPEPSQRVSTPSTTAFQRESSYRGPTPAIHRNNTPLAGSFQRESSHRSKSPTKNRYPPVHQARETASKVRERRWENIHSKLSGVIAGQFSADGLPPPQMPKSEAIALEDEIYKILADPEFMDMVEMMDQAVGDKIRGNPEDSAFSQPSSESNMMEELALEVLEDPRFPEIHRFINQVFFKKG